MTVDHDNAVDAVHAGTPSTHSVVAPLAPSAWHCRNFSVRVWIRWCESPR